MLLLVALLALQKRREELRTKRRRTKIVPLIKVQTKVALKTLEMTISLIPIDLLRSFKVLMKMSKKLKKKKKNRSRRPSRELFCRKLIQSGKRRKKIV